MIDGDILLGYLYLEQSKITEAKMKIEQYFDPNTNLNGNHVGYSALTGAYIAQQSIIEKIDQLMKEKNKEEEFMESDSRLYYGK